MRKLHWGLLAGLLLVSSLTIQAGEKRFRIQLAAANGSVFGKPVAFQEVEVAGPVLAAPAPTPVEPAPEGLQPIPEPAPPAIVAPAPGPPVYQTVGLYPRVKYEDLDNIHPFAVKKIVAVKDPNPAPPLCKSCAPACVYVMICVPPSGKFKYEIKRKDHSKIEYDYGDYEVEITSKKGVVYVDYDD